jgi:hypothetical protein
MTVFARRWSSKERASALEVLVERGADREPGSGEPVARLAREPVGLD